MNAIAAAFEKNGIHPRIAEFNIAIAKLLNSGGTISQARACVDAAEAQMLELAPSSVVSSGNALEEGEAKSVMPARAIRDVHPPLHPPRDGRDLRISAKHGHQNSVPSVREPTPQQRAIGARNAKILAITAFERAKTSDGRSWGDVGAHELDGMARDGVLAQAVKERLGALSNSQRFKTIRELMSPSEFESVLDSARGSNG